MAEKTMIHISGFEDKKALMAGKIRKILSGEIEGWISDEFRVWNNFAMGCEAVLNFYSVEIARIRRNPETGTYHGVVKMGWESKELAEITAVLHEAFGGPDPAAYPARGWEKTRSKRVLKVEF